MNISLKNSLTSSHAAYKIGRGYYYRKIGVTKRQRSDITTGGGANSYRSDIATDQIT